MLGGVLLGLVLVANECAPWSPLAAAQMPGQSTRPDEADERGALPDEADLKELREKVIAEYHEFVQRAQAYEAMVRLDTAKALSKKHRAPNGKKKGDRSGEPHDLPSNRESPSQAHPNVGM